MKALVFLLLLVTICVSCSTTSPELGEALRNFDQNPNSGIEGSFKKLCENGKRAACAKLAQVYMNKHEFENAQTYFQKACELHNLKSCADLGLYYLSERNFKEARIAFQKSDQANYTTQLSLAILSFSENNLSEAKKQSQYLCSINLSLACQFRGLIADYEKDFHGARKYYSLYNALEPDQTLTLGLSELKLGNRNIGEKLIRQSCDRQNSPKACRVVSLLDEEKKDLNFEKSLTNKCALSDKEACFKLGHLYSLNKNKIKLSERLFRKSCDLGNGLGCVEIANSIIIYSPSGDKRSVAEEGCAKGAATSCKIAYEEQLNRHEKNLLNDLQLKACNMGDADACFEIAIDHWDKDKNKTRDFFQKSCKLNSTEACFWAEYFDQDPKTEEVVSKKYCEKDVALACTNYAHKLNNTDTARLAIQYFKKACDLGDLASCALNLYNHELNNFTPSMFSSLTALCSKKNRFACYYAGITLFNKNKLNEAKSYFQEGCYLNDTSSCEYMGDLYAKLNEKKKSIKAYEDSCDRGSAYACDKL